MEYHIFEAIKTSLQWVVAPLLALATWMFKKQRTAGERREQRLVALETEAQVINVKIDFILEDVREIKTGIDKLVSRRRATNAKTN